MLNWIVWNGTVYMYKMDLVLTNLQWLMCHKTKQYQTKLNKIIDTETSPQEWILVIIQHIEGLSALEEYLNKGIKKTPADVIKLKTFINIKQLQRSIHTIYKRMHHRDCCSPFICNHLNGQVWKHINSEIFNDWLSDARKSHSIFLIYTEGEEKTKQFLKQLKYNVRLLNLTTKNQSIAIIDTLEYIDKNRQLQTTHHKKTKKTKKNLLTRTAIIITDFLTSNISKIAFSIHKQLDEKESRQTTNWKDKPIKQITYSS